MLLTSAISLELLRRTLRHMRRPAKLSSQTLAWFPRTLNQYSALSRKSKKWKLNLKKVLIS